MKQFLKNVIYALWMALSTVVLFLWQLPQIIVGAVVVAVAADKSAETFKRSLIFRFKKERTGSVTLGPIVVLDRNAREDTRKHEYGHCVQSMLLGPLYLIVIGLPSIVHAFFHVDRPGHDYMDFYTEKWANKLAERFYK